MPVSLPFQPAQSLASRLVSSDAVERPFQFVLGSALSLPERAGGPGVPGTGGVVDLILRELHQIGGLQDLVTKIDEIASDRSKNRYQESFQALRGALNPRTVNRIIQRAVLGASSEDLDLDGPREEVVQAALANLERDHEKWHLTPGMETLGRLLVEFSDRFAPEVFTTNFDPLIGVAVRRAGGAAAPFDLGRDGSPRSYKGPDVRILHLHGYWRDSNPLHTPYELSGERPQVQSHLRNVIAKRPLVCFGYGGWEDIITNTVEEVLRGGQDAELLWAFYEPTEAEVRRSQGRVLELLAPLVALGSGTSCFYGVDVHRFLPDLYERLGLRGTTTQEAGLTVTARVVEQEPDEVRCPFVVGRPIDRDEDFFGRDLHRQKLEQAIDEKQPVQILGERRMGKTSLLRWCGRRIRQKTDLPVVEVTLGGAASPLSLVRQIAEGLSSDAVSVEIRCAHFPPSVLWPFWSTRPMRCSSTQRQRKTLSLMLVAS